MKGYGLMIVVGIIALPLAYLTSSGGEPSRGRKPKEQPTDVLVAAPQDDTAKKPKTPLIEYLLKALDDPRLEGSDEQRRVLRKSLLEADDELHRSTGDNARRKILRANNPRPRPIIGRSRGSSVKPKIVAPPVITPKIEPGVESDPPVLEVKPVPAKEAVPAKPAEPAIEPAPAKPVDGAAQP